MKDRYFLGMDVESDDKVTTGSIVVFDSIKQAPVSVVSYNGEGGLQGVEKFRKVSKAVQGLYKDVVVLPLED